MRSFSAAPRSTRATYGVYAADSASTAAGRPAPNTAAASSASRMAGKANKKLRPEEITASLAPRRRGDCEQRAHWHAEDHDRQRPQQRGLRTGQQPGGHIAALEVVPEQVTS